MILRFLWMARVSQLVRTTFLFATVTMIGCVTPVGAPAKANSKTVAPTTTPLVGGSTLRHEPNAPDSVLTINDIPVTAESIWYGRHAEVAEKARTLEPRAFDFYVKQRGAQLITDRITEVLLYQNASAGLADAVNKRVDDHVAGEIRRIISSEHGGNARAYEHALTLEGDTLDTRRTRLRREVIVRSYLDQQIRPRIAEPTRRDLMGAFEVEARKVQRSPRRRMSLIDIRTEGTGGAGLVTPEAKTAAQTRMQAVQDSLRSGTSFADVARQHSDGLHAPDGGSWGWVALGSVREKFEPAVESLFKLDAGQMSDVIDAGDRFFLVRCDDIDNGATPDFESIQPELTERHFRQEYNKAISKLITELRDKAVIKPMNLESFHRAVVLAAPNPNATEGPLDTR